MNVLRANQVSRIVIQALSMLLVIMVTACNVVAELPAPTPSTTAVPIPVASYQDPDGRFSIVIPTHWKTTQEQGYGMLTDPDNVIKVYALSVPGNDVEKGIAAAWAVVDSSFK